jgi:hypothetical protein
LIARPLCAGAPPEFVEVQRAGWRQERRTRRLAQVFLRGDSIVLVGRWPAAASAVPAGPGSGPPPTSAPAQPGVQPGTLPLHE